MRRFLPQFRDKIIGVIDGFDRIVFRGWLGRLCYAEGMQAFLASQQVMLKDFEPFAKTLADGLRLDAEALAARLHGKVHYLPSPNISKEGVALKYMADRKVRFGPICVLSALDPCWTWEVRRSRAREHPQHFRRKVAKCLHYYHYFVDRRFGFGHVRVQSWFPFQVRVCLNGRDWLWRRLARQHQRRGGDSRSAAAKHPWRGERQRDRASHARGPSRIIVVIMRCGDALRDDKRVGDQVSAIVEADREHEVVIARTPGPVAVQPIVAVLRHGRLTGVAVDVYDDVRAEVGFVGARPAHVKRQTRRVQHTDELEGLRRSRDTRSAHAGDRGRLVAVSVVVAAASQRRSGHAASDDRQQGQQSNRHDVVLIAGPAPGTDDAILRHGIDDPGVAFLQKPFSRDALLRKVRATLDEAP